MILDFEKLWQEPRVLLEAVLKVTQGARFQPASFADLGPARYSLPDSTQMLLVESPQSIANRLELACLDDARQDLISPLSGLPYIRVLEGNGKYLTSSLTEAHRINSDYVMRTARRLVTTKGKTRKADVPFASEFASEIEYLEDAPVNWHKFYMALMKYDPNSLLHGCFLEEIGGRLRAIRLVSGFIEASGVIAVESGGVKNNIVQPNLKGGDGNLPFHRIEFVAKEIKAFFHLDLALLRSYSLDEDAAELFVALSLFKIKRFLSTGLRLRSACDLEVDGSLKVVRPTEGVVIDGERDEEALLQRCKQLIGKCKAKGLFAHPAITEVQLDDPTLAKTNSDQTTRKMTAKSKKLTAGDEEDH